MRGGLTDTVPSQSIDNNVASSKSSESKSAENRESETNKKGSRERSEIDTNDMPLTVTVEEMTGPLCRAVKYEKEEEGALRMLHEEIEKSFVAYGM